jgi:hypothetical protein
MAVGTTPKKILKALDLVADYFNPRFGPWANRAFDAINAAFFDDRLPRPLIQWAITPHGACLGLTDTWKRADRPIVTLHPSIMAPAASNPWGVDDRWLGPAYAFDVLLHESIHVAQHTLHRDMPKGESSHNCESWVLEVNRLAPMLGMEGVTAGRSRPRRVAVPGEFTVTGRPATRVERVDDGDIPLKYHSTFPHGVRRFLGTAESHYLAGRLPCGIVIDGDRPTL